MRRLLLAGALLTACATHRSPNPLLTPRMDGYFPDAVLTDQGGRQHRFYSDLVRDKVVVINFMYTTCTKKCPRVSSNLAEVQAAFGSRLGRDVLMLSITLDPERDTPAALAGYAAVLGAKPGWLFLTGREDDIQLIRRKLGVTDPDPKIDADRTQHSGLVVYGNDSIGRWAAVPGLMRPALIADAVLRIADRDASRGPSAASVPVATPCRTPGAPPPGAAGVP